MPDPQIEKLLIVQDRDRAVQKIEQELERLPRERSAIEERVRQEEANIEAARSSLKAKEVERHELDNEVKSRETAVARFRNQQLEVKKNDEYRALSHQIEQTEAEIGQIEEKEIGLMLEIDEEKKRFEAEKAGIEQRIQDCKAQLAQSEERGRALRSSLEGACEALEKARAEVDGPVLAEYDRVRKMTKRAPYVVPLEGQQCTGCHLRVSNEVARSVHNRGELHFCDQCSRIVYL